MSQSIRYFKFMTMNGFRLFFVLAIGLFLLLIAILLTIKFKYLSEEDRIFVEAESNVYLQLS